MIVPIVVIIVLSICLGIPLSKAVRSGLMVGVSFIGTRLIISMISSGLTPAVQAMSDRMGLCIRVIDIGWTGVSPMSWAASFSVFAVLSAILVNIVMLELKLTKTVNIDLWNIWHMIFTGAAAYTVTGNFLVGIGGVMVHAAISYKLGDFFAPLVERYFELEGLTIPNGTSAYMAPISCFIDTMIDHIPIVSQIYFSFGDLQGTLGAFTEPAVAGGILGWIIGLLSGYSLDKAFLLGITMAAAMVLLPRIVSCISEGLMPLSEKMRGALSHRYGREGYYMGLDPTILLGDSQVMTTGTLFIPLTLLIALLLPGNQILPFGDLATISFFTALSVAVHKGNLFRSLISGSAVMAITLWIANQTVPWITCLAKATGISDGTCLVTALDPGGSPITYLYVQAFLRDNLTGLGVIGFGYLICILCTLRYFQKARCQTAQADPK